VTKPYLAPALEGPDYHTLMEREREMRWATLADFDGEVATGLSGFGDTTDGSLEALAIVGRKHADDIELLR